MNLTKLKPYIIILILLVGVFVAFSPSTVYAPTPRVVLFFILSVLPAILFGSEVVSKFNVNLPGFIFSVAGAGAIFFGALFLLDYLAKPEEMIAVYSFYDEDGDELIVDAPGLLDIKTTKTGLTVTAFKKGNTLIMIFPEQVPEVEITFKKMITAKPYRGKLGYAGSRKADITLGLDLKQ